MKIQRCKGTRDLSPEEMSVFCGIEGTFRDCCLNWGYKEVPNLLPSRTNVRQRRKPARTAVPKYSVSAKANLYNNARFIYNPSVILI